MTLPTRPRLRPEQLDLGCAVLLVKLDAFATVDPFELHAWARARLNDLRHDFYHSGERPEDFPIWLRCQFLNRKVTSC